MSKLDKDGQQRDELKDKTKDKLGPTSPETDPNSLARVLTRNTQFGKTKSPDSAHNTIKVSVDQGKTIVFPSDATLNKPEAELLARSFRDKKKEDTVPLDKAIEFAKGRSAQLQKEKVNRKQQVMRIIQQLRTTDPKGKKTCGRCGFRVPIIDMDSRKELCEICAS